MSSNFIPMLSSSPPPIDDNDSPENDDEDDAFGMFTSANLDFDGSFDSSTPGDLAHFENVESPIKTSNKLINNDNQVNCFSKSSHISVFSINKVVDQNSKLDFNDLEKSETILEQEVKSKCCSADDPSSKEELLNNFTSDGHNDDASQCNNEQYTSSQKHSSSACNKTLSKCEPDESVSVLSSEVANLSEPCINEKISEFNSDLNKCLNNKSIVCDSLSLETVHISERVNRCSVENVEEKVNNEHYEFNGVYSAKLSDEDDCVTNKDVPFSEKTLDLNVVNSDQDSLTRTDPPDKYSSLSHGSSDNDEFEDFKFATVENEFSNVSTNNQDPVVSNSSNQFDDDDFGDFESVNVPSFNAFNDVSAEVCKPDKNEFADFSNSHVVDNDSSWVVDESDFQSAETVEFADFEDASSKNEHQFVPKLSVISKESPGNSEKISKLISTVFPVSESIELSEDSDDNLDILEQNNKSRRLWDKLHDTNKTPGIPFQWGVSHSFQQLLRSVNIDYHSILRTSTVPFFASGLGLLEPTKGPGTQPAKDSNSHFNDETNDSKDPIPPVSFDWGSSGLINPLDSNQDMSALMDLTFLAASDETASSRRSSDTFSLENELLRPDLDVTVNTATVKAPILEQILSMSANTSTISTDSASGSRPPNLSQEAVHVLDQLPNISFIRAKVLMFPFSSNT